MWLEAASTNNNPFVVCSFFVETVKHLGGLPYIVRADKGTENVNVEMTQKLLRMDNDDNRSGAGTTFLYGSSPSNQRIEAWWSKFPQHGMTAWIEYFQMLELHGIIDTSKKMDIQCVRFCYFELLRKELDLIRMQWNTHHIRPSKKSCAPSGKPETMFRSPELYDTRSYLQEVSVDNLTLASDIAAHDTMDCSREYRELFECIVADFDLENPSSINGAAHMLAFILDIISDELVELD